MSEEKERRCCSAATAQPPAAPVETKFEMPDCLSGARKQAMDERASMLPQPPAAPVETETRFHTDEDREYARGLLEDMDDEQSNAVDSRINIAAQWFCKARVETARRVAKQVRPESASREAVLEAQGTIEQLEKQLAFERKKSEPSFLHAGSPLWRIDLLCEQHELYTKDELVGLIQKVVQDDFCSRAQRIANDMG